MKQNIAIICLSSNSGGMEIDSIKLAQKLTKYASITLIAKEATFIAKEIKRLKDPSISLETISFKSSMSLSLLLNARKVIREQKIKNVIFFGASELKSLYFAFLGLDLNLIVRHGTTKSRPKKDWFHRLIYSEVNYHVSICKHLKKNVEYIIPFGKQTKGKLIYSSCNFDKPKNIKKEKLTLVHVGRIAPAKGQIDAMKACQILIDNNIDFEFNIVGGFEESYEKEFMEFYENCSYKNKFNLIGFTDNVKYYLENADIFLFPTHGEGLSNAFLEALSYNLICLSYNNTSFPELMELGLYFKMVEHLNAKDLSSTLLETTKNLNNERDSCAKNHDRIKNLFSLQKEMEEYLKILG
jgi:glycosyltransferase involved in cell wall biosynthesis